MFFEDRMYRGDWDNGRMHGVGKYVDAGGNMYVGEFIENSKKGLGKVIASNGGTVFGNWLDGEVKILQLKDDDPDVIENYISFDEFKGRAMDLKIQEKLMQKK